MYEHGSSFVIGNAHL